MIPRSPQITTTTATTMAADLVEERMEGRVTVLCLVHSCWLAVAFRDALLNSKGSLEWKKQGFSG